ncbi:hypothetical protein [uncultured Brevibacterium sp.]|uniref:hypothetical protein n=1 Tax=uncultured Brevibacterium sp. TaxID=189678 RepID=UPI0025FBEA4D|nr:hypothetical protein [uncultured Brevibacterium sp.]
MNDFRDIAFSKGFMLTRDDTSSVAHFVETPLWDGWTLWSDDFTPTSRATAGADVMVLIRGQFLDGTGVSSDDVASKLAESLAISYEKFERTLGALLGRYMVIARREGETWLYHDALGLRSVYYDRDSGLVGSHARLVSQKAKREAIHGAKETRYRLDYTIFDRVWQLLPNFRLNLNTLEVERFFPRAINRYLDWSPEEKLDKVQELWGNAHRELLNRWKNVVLSITAGLDSRFVLAMLKDHRQDISTITYGNPRAGASAYSQSMYLDYSRVAEMLPYIDSKEHWFVDLTDTTPDDPRLLKLARINSFKSHGRKLLARMRNLFEEPDWIHLRGTGVEIVRRYWKESHANFAALKKYMGLTTASDVAQAKEMGYGAVLHGFMPDDLAYWELRMGKWHSEIMNEQDILYETIVPLGMRDIIELLLSYPIYEREEALAIYDLIDRNMPELTLLPVNDDDSIFNQRRESVALKGRALLKNLSFVSREIEETTNVESPVLSFENFAMEKNATVTADLYVAERAGGVSFTVHSSYQNLNAMGYAKWQVLLNGAVVCEDDCARTAAPVALRFLGLSKGDLISVRLESLRDLAGHQSWLLASRVSCKDLTPFKGSRGGGEVEITAIDQEVTIFDYSRDEVLNP